MERRRLVTEKMLDVAGRVIPELRDAIVFRETATPITEERFMRCTAGVSYGPAFTPRQTWLRPGPKSPVPGLYLAGAYTRPFHGLIGTLYGGVAAAAVAGTSQHELLELPPPLIGSPTGRTRTLEAATSTPSTSS